MNYDAFISYQAADRAFAERLASVLTTRSVRVWFDQWDLRPGELVSQTIERALVDSRAVLFIFGPSGFGKWQELELSAFLSHLVQQPERRFVPILAPGASIEHVPLFLQQYQFLDFRYEEHAPGFDRLVHLLRGQRELSPPKLLPPKVFLCHAKEDAPRVEHLYYALRDRDIDPWYDKENLTVGDDWESEIIHAIEKSDFFAVFLSCVSSEKIGFIQKELRTAVKEYQRRPPGAVYLLPIRLEECTVPTVKLDDNKRLSDLQWADLFEDDSLAVDKLASAILKQWKRRAAGK